MKSAVNDMIKLYQVLDVSMLWVTCTCYVPSHNERTLPTSRREMAGLDRYGRISREVTGVRSAEPEVPVEDAALEPSSPAEQGPMQGAVRRRFKADLLAIAAAADAGPEAASPEEDYGLPLSSKERRRQKAGVPCQHASCIQCLSF